MEIIESTLIQTQSDIDFAFENGYGICVEYLDTIFKTKNSIKTYSFLINVAESEGCLGYVDYEIERLVKFCY